MTLGQRLAEIRGERGLSLRGAARELGVEPWTYKMWEHDQCQPKPERLRNVMMWIELTPAEMLDLMADGELPRRLKSVPGKARAVEGGATASSTGRSSTRSRAGARRIPPKRSYRKVAA